MNWLKRKLRNWLNESDYSQKVEAIGIRADESRPEQDPILTFRIYSATNGQILEFRRWDQKNDRSYNSTYIVERDKDLGEYVNKCLSLEMLK